jgi:7 transmembrane receptor (rhodopsin family).
MDFGYKIRLLYFIGVIGNALIIVYFLKTNKKSLSRMSSYHFLIVKLALADLLVCTLFSLENWSRRFPSQYHDTLFVIKGTSISVSCWLLVFLSFERYRNIVHRFKQEITKRQFTLVTILTTLFFLASYVSYVLRKDNLLAVETFLYTLSGYVLMDNMLPITFMCYFYRRISKTLLSAPVVVTTDIANSQRHLQNKKAAQRTLKLLILIYVVCVLPGRLAITLFYILHQYMGVISLRTTDLLNNAVKFLVCMNNVVNVFVYTKMIVDFRRFVINVFTCGCTLVNKDNHNLHHFNTLTRLSHNTSSQQSANNMSQSRLNNKIHISQGGILPQ